MHIVGLIILHHTTLWRSERGQRGRRREREGEEDEEQKNEEEEEDEEGGFKPASQMFYH